MKKYIWLVLVLLLLFPPGSLPSAHAEGKEYTGVLEDLQKDESFSESYYPVVADDYSLQMVQIAESSDKELFVY